MTVVFNIYLLKQSYLEVSVLVNFYDYSPKYATSTALLTSLLSSTDPVITRPGPLKFVVTSNPHVQRFLSHCASNLYLYREDLEPKAVFWFPVSCIVWVLFFSPTKYCKSFIVQGLLGSQFSQYLISQFWQIYKCERMGSKSSLKI